MKRLWCLIPGMVLTAAWGQSIEPISVAYTHFPEIKGAAVRQDGRAWLALDRVKDIGWRVSQVSTDQAEFNADGRTIRVPTQTINGATHLNMEEAVRQLGALSWFDGDRYFVTGELRQLDLSGSRIKADGTLSFKSSSFLLENPRRLVVDLNGLSLPKDIRLSMPAGTRVGQLNETTVRIVVENPAVRAPRTTRPHSARALDLDLSPFEFRSNTVEPAFTLPDPPVTPVGHTTDAPHPVPARPAAAAPRILRSVRQENAASNRGTVTFVFDRANSQLPRVNYLDPTTIQVDLPNTTWTPTDLPKSDENLISSIEVASTGTNTWRATIRTRQPALFRLTQSGMGIALALRTPADATGTLRGKTIVIDPGHGGVDSGAHWAPTKTSEKTIVLNVGLQVADFLEAEGANVILTRSTDVRISLAERAAIANRNRADAFISIHVNSNRLVNSRSGTITFHHMQEPGGKLLSTCLHNEIVKAAGLPNIGVWSDSRIYQSGFAVLRQTDMPATLLELGFINHATDRAAMVRPEWQTRVARSIVQGLKVFFGDVKEESKP